MISPFFAVAAVSPGRQQAFRQAVAAHLLVVGCAAAVCWRHGPGPFLGHLLLVAGVVEGAVLVGWRLTQLPKSQALEFFLVSPLRPRRFFLAEAAVGLSRLALVTLSGLPVLILLTWVGRYEPETLHPVPPPLLTADLLPLIAVPFTWGAITGLGLAVWAYELPAVRRWGERVLLGLVVVYLGVGVLAGENLIYWLSGQRGAGQVIVDGFRAFHQYNPFGVLQAWLEQYGTDEDGTAFARTAFLGLQGAAVGVFILLVARAAGRLQAHFHELHYSPAADSGGKRRAEVGERPLAWWAVRRVTRYSGRVNLWLAGGFGLLYSLYLLVGPERWPLGRMVFVLVEKQAGGVPGLAAALVILAAVPAAFQYGLWDSNAQDRCRRLELLLLTRLSARDYWDAAAAAAWRRGRGYFAVAVLLWSAAAVAGGEGGGLTGLATAAAAGVVLWGLYFALGFRAFASGMQANRLGTLLTLGLPALAYALYRVGWPTLAALTPPGSVYEPAAGAARWLWLPGPLLGGAAALALARLGLAGCDADLRRWYDRHHGRKVMD